MGLKALPTSGSVCVDSQIIIYTVENHPKYVALLRAFWASIDKDLIVPVVSELSLLEVLVVPLRVADQQLVNDYEHFLGSPRFRRIPISAQIIRQAAQLRAQIKSIKTPDAIHAATAQVEKAQYFLTNDRVFQNIPGLNAIILDDIANP